ncbi:MAG TPA: hypothetical protein VJN44_15695 [Roseateles sp.]|nr:hypothetical protein [Roseateles sp.]
MKTSKLTPLIAASMLLGSGWALADISPDISPNPPMVPATEPAQPREPHDPDAALSRAEVVADLNLWRKAGLNTPDGDAAGERGAQSEQQARLERYMELRDGPVFLAEVERVERGRMTRER